MTSKNINLHYIESEKTAKKLKTIIFLHGLFGSASNLSKVAHCFNDKYQTVQVDLRNHGLSSWSTEITYEAMSLDLKEFVNSYCKEPPIIIGHSMGGKVAMKFAKSFPELIERLIVLDIAPVSYPGNKHQAVFEALQKTTLYAIKPDVLACLSQMLPIETVQFLMKSYKNNGWLFNLAALNQAQKQIQSWEDSAPCFIPTLFLKSDHSNYINEMGEQAILMQFPISTIETINNAGHNIHLEQPSLVCQKIKEWLD